MGLFSRKNPSQEYPKHKKAYLDKIYLIVKQGCLKLGDLLQIPYVFKNKPGLMDAAAQIENIYYN